MFSHYITEWQESLFHEQNQGGILPSYLFSQLLFCQRRWKTDWSKLQPQSLNMKTQGLFKRVSAGVCLVPVGELRRHTNHRENTTRSCSHTSSQSVKYHLQSSISPGESPKQKLLSYKIVANVSKSGSFIKTECIARVTNNGVISNQNRMCSKFLWLESWGL